MPFVSSVPPDPSAHEPSAAAEQARARLHEEIERVRSGVEGMLAEQGSAADADLRRELDTIQEECRRYVKQRVRKSEKRIEKQLRKVDERSQQLERRIDQVDQDRKYAEWRIHTNTEQMLDGLLREVKAIADLLTRTR
jgi:septation ring formation regulator EzrA